jgi:hypothetical protein
MREHGVAAAKLSLHEILSDKIRYLEQAIVLQLVHAGGNDSTRAASTHASTFSRSPSLFALVDGLVDAREKAVERVAAAPASSSPSASSVGSSCCSGGISRRAVAEVRAQTTAEISALCSIYRAELAEAESREELEPVVGRTRGFPGDCADAREAANAMASTLATVHPHEAEKCAAEVEELRSRLAEEKEAREAAERVAVSNERACQLLQSAAGGDDSFEAALAQELAAMRDAYEAKLAAANELARTTATAHRREIRLLQEAAERAQRQIETRARLVGRV